MAVIIESKYDGSAFEPGSEIDNGLIRGAKVDSPLIIAKRPKNVAEPEQPIRPSDYIGRTVGAPPSEAQVDIIAPVDGVEAVPKTTDVLKKEAPSINLPVFDIFQAEKLMDRIKSVNNAVFENPESHPLVLLIAVGHIFGGDWLTWEAETMWMELEHRGVKNIPRLVKDKILAVRAAHRINDFYSNYYAFEKLGCAFNDKVADFHHIQLLNMAELVNTINILDVIRDDDKYTPEIQAYVTMVAHNEGMITFHPILSKKIPIFGAEDLLMEDVEQRMKELKEDQSTFNKESTIDWQAAKLLTIDEYIAEENKQFSDQMYYYFVID